MAKLANEVALGLHLSAGASDGYITSAEYIYDETKNQKLQATLDALEAGSGYVLPTATSNVLGGVRIGNGITINSNGEISAADFVDEGDKTILISWKGGSGDDAVAYEYDIPTTQYIATSEHEGLMSADDKAKLDALVASSGSSSYTLPTASADTLGGIKVGTGLSISSDGTLSADNSETMTEITDDEITALFS